MTSSTIFYCHGNVFTELLPSNDGGMHRQTHRHKRTTVLLLLRVCVCRGNVFTEPLPNNERRVTLYGAVAYGFEFDSVAMIYIPSVIKND
jgi:hypothetical protein